LTQFEPQVERPEVQVPVPPPVRTQVPLEEQYQPPPQVFVPLP
jgi:hypothetical protein